MEEIGCQNLMRICIRNANLNFSVMHNSSVLDPYWCQCGYDPDPNFYHNADPDLQHCLVGTVGYVTCGLGP